MPRRSAADSEESPAPRRSSSRIASQVSKSPATASPAKKPASKRASKKLAEETTLDSLAETQMDTNDTKVPVIPHSGDQDTSEPSVKQQKLDDVENIEASGQESIEQATKLDDETGFEIIEKDSVPPMDSAEVNEALAAQGEEGHLLVNFVQFSKDELPSTTISHVTDSGAVPVDVPTIVQESLPTSWPETDSVLQETHPVAEHSGDVILTIHQNSEIETEQDVVPEAKQLDTVVVVDSESPSPQDMEAI